MKKPLSEEVLEVLDGSVNVNASDLLSRVEAQTYVAADERTLGTRFGANVGTYQGRNREGEPLVDFPHNPVGTAVVARSIVPLSRLKAGSEVVLMFDSGDARRPIVLGVVLQPPAEAQASPPDAIEASVDGERVTIQADKEVVIKCGEASITLTRAGKVLIRGTYVLSRSSGANRIKGASVGLN